MSHTSTTTITKSKKEVWTSLLDTITASLLEAEMPGSGRDERRYPMPYTTIIVKIFVMSKKCRIARFVDIYKNSTTVIKIVLKTHPHHIKSRLP